MCQEYKKRIKCANDAAGKFFESAIKANNMNLLENHQQIDELFLRAFDVAGKSTEEDRDFWMKYSTFYEYKAYLLIVSGELEKRLNGRKMLTNAELKLLHDQLTIIMDEAIKENDKYKPDYLKNKEEIISDFNKALEKNGFTIKKDGCYIATLIYGSYDCPQVWILRRYRDIKLSNSYFGRKIICIYYFISPSLVKWFGNKRWFTYVWRKTLDIIIGKLLKCGYEDTPYIDQML